VPPPQPHELAAPQPGQDEAQGHSPRAVVGERVTPHSKPGNGPGTTTPVRRSGPAKGPFALKLLASRASRVGGLRAQAETEVQGQSTTGYSCRARDWLSLTRGPPQQDRTPGSPALLEPRLHGGKLEPHVPPKPHARHRTRPRRLPNPRHRHAQPSSHLVRVEKPLAHATLSVRQ